MDYLSFDQLPRIVQELSEKVDRQSKLLEQIAENSFPDKDMWMDIDQLTAYLPNHPVRKTIYKKVEQNIIPYHRRKDGKTLYFLKSEIDLYLREGKRKTKKEIEMDADEILSRRHKRSK